MGIIKSTAGYSLAAQIGVASGVQRLIETPLVINGAEGSTILRFRGSDASAAGWPEIGNAGTLALQAGTAPTYGVASPFGGATPETGVKFNAGGYFQLAGIGDISTEDFAVEAVTINSGGYSGYGPTFGTWAGTGYGWMLYEGVAGRLDLIAFGPGGSAHPIGAVAIGQLVHTFAIYDAGAFTRLYQNAVLADTIDVSAVGSLTTANPLYAGGFPTKLSNNKVFYLAIHSRAAGWLDTSAQATLVANRFALLTGTRPLISIATPPATSLAAGGNVGPAYQSRIVSGADRLFYMGAGAPRFTERVDGAGRTFRGALVEVAAQNIALQSQTLATSWDRYNLTNVSSDSANGPDGTATLDGLIGNAIAGIHGVYQIWTFTDAQWVISGYARVGDKSWLYADDAVRTAYFDIANCALGTLGAGVTAGIVDLGGGLRRWWFSRLMAAGAKTCFTLAAEADNDISFSGDTTTVNVYLGGVNVELGEYPSSPIVTTTAAVTRAADTPHRYSGAGHFGVSKGSSRFGFLSPTFTPGRNHYLHTYYKAGSSTTDYITIYIQSGTGHLVVESACTGGNPGSVELSTNYCDNLVHDVILSWQKDNLRLWVDRVAATPDTSCDFSAGLDTVDVGASNNADNQAGPILPEYPFINPRADKWG